jgi:hypothetical protein
VDSGVSPVAFGKESRLMRYNGTVSQMENVVFVNSSIEVTSIQPGDLDGDGDVDFNDLIAVLNLILLNEYHYAGDVDEDGDIDFNDLIGVLNIILTS